LVQLERLVHKMPRGELLAGRTAAEKLVLRVLTGVRLAELDRLVRAEGPVRDQRPQRLGLDTALAEIQEGLAALSDALSAQYFHHEEQPHSLVGLGRADQGGAAGGERP
jgi:uncharacterized alpha-E superfamily protein